jgi:hypothetical protein
MLLMGCSSSVSSSALGDARTTRDVDEADRRIGRDVSRATDEGRTTAIPPSAIELRRVPESPLVLSRASDGTRRRRPRVCDGGHHPFRRASGCGVPPQGASSPVYDRERGSSAEPPLLELAIAMASTKANNDRTTALLHAMKREQKWEVGEGSGC